MTIKQEQPPFPVLLDDEPEIDTILFEYDKKAEDLSDIISMDRKSPFAILLNGEWGSGKTSLMKITKKRLEQKENMKACKIIEFNAWQYEGFDPRSALLVKIVQKCQNKNMNTIEKIINNIPNFNVGVNLGILSINTDSRDIIEQYVQNTDKIENLHKYLEQSIIKENKLIVFIDDLDRCSVENALNILESIKIFLSIKNTTFIVGSDLEKLERAWELRYGKNTIDKNESKNHIDKIFQLCINLPHKDKINMEKYMDSLNKNTEFFNGSVKELIIKGCKANPRSFKRILNLISILWFLGNKYKISQNDNKVILTAIAIMSIEYPQLLKYIKIDPKTYFALSFLAINYENHSALKQYREDIYELTHRNVRIHREPSQIRTNTKVYPLDAFTSLTIDALRYITDNKHAFELMRTLGEKLLYGDSEIERLLRVEDEKRNEMKELINILNSSSLFI
jgi:predicted KAP-like P-loop ATPase